MEHSSQPTGSERSCPFCGEIIRIGALLCRFCNRSLTPDLYAPCPFCSELIARSAKVCRFCHTRVEPVPLQPSPPPYGLMLGASYGMGVRAQVFEVIVRQAMAGAPWKEICAGPMRVNDINPEEVEREVARRRQFEKDRPKKKQPTTTKEFCFQIDKLISEICSALHGKVQQQELSAIESLRAELIELLTALHESNEQVRHYDGLLDLLNQKNKIIDQCNKTVAELEEQLRQLRKEDE